MFLINLSCFLLCLYLFNVVLFSSPDPTEVYTWGNNINFSLGHGNQESRHHPEIVDLFARTGVYIKQVFLSAIFFFICLFYHTPAGQREV